MKNQPFPVFFFLNGDIIGFPYHVPYIYQPSSGHEAPYMVLHRGSFPRFFQWSITKLHHLEFCMLRGCLNFTCCLKTDPTYRVLLLQLIGDPFFPCQLMRYPMTIAKADFFPCIWGVGRNPDLCWLPSPVLTLANALIVDGKHPFFLLATPISLL